MKCIRIDSRKRLLSHISLNGPDDIALYFNEGKSKFKTIVIYPNLFSKICFLNITDNLFCSNISCFRGDDGFAFRKGNGLINPIFGDALIIGREHMHPPFTLSDATADIYELRNLIQFISNKHCANLMMDPSLPSFNVAPERHKIYSNN